MQHPELPFGAFLAAVLALIPAVWHWRARNVAIISLIAWLFILNVIYGVNSIVWAGNAWNPAPVWCDISAKLIIGGSSALPACSLCICKYLELVGSNRKAKFDTTDRRRIAIFDLSLCWGLPIVLMALHYIVQGHRFDLYEDLGCRPTTYYSIPAIIIVWLPPLVLAAATFAYAGLALYHFMRMRIMFRSVLQSSNSSMTTNRYLRLVAMSVIEMMWGISLTSVTIWANAATDLRPWSSWSFVHSNWNRADVYIWMIIPPSSQPIIFLLWWAAPVSSYIFFVFFGFGEDAMKQYRKIGTWLSSRVLKVLSRFSRQALRLSSVSTYSVSTPPPQYNYRPPPSMGDRTGSNNDEKTLDISSPCLEKLTIPSISSVQDRKEHTKSTFYYNSTTPLAISPSASSRFSISDDHIAYGRSVSLYRSSQPPSPSESSQFHLENQTYKLSPVLPVRIVDHDHNHVCPSVTLPTLHLDMALDSGSIMMATNSSSKTYNMV